MSKRRLYSRLLKLPPQIAYAVGLGPIIGRLVLLLTTTGRKTGLSRVTPLQYEEQDGVIYIGSARGTQADWYKNLVANPQVEVRVKTRRFKGIAETCTDPVVVADFIEMRLERRPRIIGAILRSEGISLPPGREELEVYAANLALVTIRPVT